MVTVDLRCTGCGHGYSSHRGPQDEHIECRVVRCAWDEAVKGFATITPCGCERYAGPLPNRNTSAQVACPHELAGGICVHCGDRPKGCG